MSNPTLSRSVCWSTVHTFVVPFIDSAGVWPMAGSVEWQQLSDTDPAKWVALLDAAQHHVLRVETCQVALAEASRDVQSSGAAAVALKALRWEQDRQSVAYIPRRGVGR